MEPCQSSYGLDGEYSLFNGLVSSENDTGIRVWGNKNSSIQGLVKFFIFRIKFLSRHFREKQVQCFGCFPFCRPWLLANIQPHHPGEELDDPAHQDHLSSG